MVGISVCCKAVRDCMANQLIKHPTQGMDALWYRFVHIYIYIYIYIHSRMQLDGFVRARAVLSQAILAKVVEHL
jgi:hypothetical protein